MDDTGFLFGTDLACDDAVNTTERNGTKVFKRGQQMVCRGILLQP